MHSPKAPFPDIAREGRGNRSGGTGLGGKKRCRCRTAVGVRALQVLVAWSAMLSGSPERGAVAFRAFLQPSAAAWSSLAAGSSASRLAVGRRALVLRSSPRAGILSATCAARKGGKCAVFFWVHRVRGASPARSWVLGGCGHARRGPGAGGRGHQWVRRHLSRSPASSTQRLVAWMQRVAGLGLVKIVSRNLQNVSNLPMCRWTLDTTLGPPDGTCGYCESEDWT